MEGYNKDTQLKLNFDEEKEQEAFKKKQKEVGEKFGIINYEELQQKEDDEWYMYGMKVEDYIKTMSEKDNTDLYKIPIKNKEDKIITKNPVKKEGLNKEGSVIIPFDPEK